MRVIESVTLKVDAKCLKNYGYVSDLHGETKYGVPLETIYWYECRGFEIETEFILNPWIPCRVVQVPLGPTNYVPSGTFIVRAVKYD